MRQRWLVDGNDLDTKRRRGGRIALKGFNFQAGYAVLCMIDLITCKDGVVKVRYEGAQDIDVYHANGTEIYIQCKETPDKLYRFEELLEILAGFTSDVIDACINIGSFSSLDDLNLYFEIYSTGIPIGDAFANVIHGTNLLDRAAEVVTLLTSKQKHQRSEVEVLKCAEYVLKHIYFHIGPRKDPIPTLREQAAGRLVSIGIPVDGLSASIDGLWALAQECTTIYANHVGERLAALPSEHPASPNAAFRFLSGPNLMAGVNEIREIFEQSGRPEWGVFLYELDIERDSASNIRRKIESLSSGGGAIIISGGSGTGKSTLARRVAWDLHCSGKLIVVEAIRPGNVSTLSWKAIGQLASTSGRTVLVVIDEVFQYPDVLDLLEEEHIQGVVLLGTTRSHDFKPLPTKMRAVTYEMSAISEFELERVQKKYGIPKEKVDRRQIEGFMRAGQMLALTLSLKSDDPRAAFHNLACGLIQPLQNAFPSALKAYIYLCVCGQYDQSVQRSVIGRMCPDIDKIIFEKTLKSLVFEEQALNNRLRTGHALIAKAVLTATSSDVFSLAIGLIRQVDPTDGEERRFSLKLLANLSRDKQVRHHFAKADSLLVDQIRSLTVSADYLELRTLATALRNISARHTDMQNFADELNELTNSIPLRTKHDIVAFMSCSKASQALDFKRAVIYFENNSTPSTGMQQFIRWISDEAARASWEIAIPLILDWLRRTKFPAMETKSFIYLLNYSGENSSNFEKHIVDAIAARRYDPSETNDVECLSAASRAATEHFRSGMLLKILVEQIELYFSDVQLAQSVGLAVALANAARLAETDVYHSRVCSKLLRCLPFCVGKTPKKLLFRIAALAPGKLQKILSDKAREIIQVRNSDSFSELVDEFASTGLAEITR